MSWNRTNLFNLWRRQNGSLRYETDFSKSDLTLFQQRWISKRLVRAFHGDFINERTFKRWYLPKTLPDVRPAQPLAVTDALAKFASANKARHAQDKERREQEDGAATQLPPVGSLMFSEIERRIDVLIFRACLAQSVYDARRLVIHGYVLLNGRPHQNTNTRLAPGDMVSVDPSMIPWLQRKPSDVRRDAVKARKRAEKARLAEQFAAGETASADGEAAAKPAAEAGASESEAAEEGHYWEESDGAKQKLPHGRKLVPATPRTGPEGEKYSNVCNLPDWCSPWLFVPAYLEVCYKTCSFVYVRHPTARPGYSEIATPFAADGEVVKLAWEWYAKNRPRMRSKSQLAREPLNRQ